ncbi:MAG: penicillin-binding protein 2 [Alphaproteobacteria bacterium]|nr:penicillin-binding protein 2 [Alphaproteobacteria bacterium]
MTDLATRTWKRLLHEPPPLSVDPEQRLSEARARRPIEMARTRLLIAGAVFALCFVVLAGRLLEIGILKEGNARSDGGARLTSDAAPGRVDIVDRNGVLLATNLPTVSLYADQETVLSAEGAADRLLTVLPRYSREDLVERITGKARHALIERNLTPDQAFQINQLGLPGFSFERTERRVYLQGPLFSHVLGYTDVDNHGLSGIEAGLDATLRTTEPESGRPFTVSLDMRVQHALTEELNHSIEEFSAIGGAGVVIDANTGEVLALVSLPSFDPNGRRKSDDDVEFNRVTKGIYELGSTFKAFTVAMALDYGVVDMNDGYDASHPIKIARYTIRDDHPQNRWLNVPEIFMHSSNIGAAKMALDVGGERQREFLERLGLLNAYQLELPEVGAPAVPKPWREINTMTIAFGHGLSITPLHLANGIATLVNGGVLRRPTFVKQPEGATISGDQVISPATSEKMRRLLRLVVTEGTGQKAAAPGYLVGGKTGTAEKAAVGGYQRKSLISTFVGAFPMQNPRYVVLAMIDEPKGNRSSFGFATAGWTAAPVVGRVISRIAPLLGIEPVDEDADPIHRELDVKEVSQGARLASF